MSQRLSNWLTLGVLIVASLTLSSASFAQPASGPPVFAGIFGSRDLQVENPNNPGTDYTVVLHQSGGTEDIAYDPGRGWGFEEIFPDFDGPYPRPDRDGAQFGPFDDSPNNRSTFSDEIPDQLYDSFIGFKDFTAPCNEAEIGDPNEPCAPTIDADGGIFRIDAPNGAYRFVGVFGSADNNHTHRFLVEDGGSGPPADGDGEHVVIVHNHDQAQWDVGPNFSGGGSFARVGFDDKLPPEAVDEPMPGFVNMDETGMPTEGPPNSPVLNVTQGYMRLHILQGNSNSGDGGAGDPNGGDIVLFEVYPVAGDVVAALQPGDADQDLDFDQIDLVQVQVAAKYLTGNPATWGEGDWNGAPGGSQGMPPVGDGTFDQLDIIAALNAGKYLTGPYAAVAATPAVEGDGQTSVIYNPGTGEVGVDAPAGTELTSINVDSAAGIFTGEAAQSLGGSFDNDADANIFKATFGGSFGSLSFGNVAQSGLSKDFVLGDLTVVGSLAGGGDLGAVDLIYVPEPSTFALLGLAVLAVLGSRKRIR